MNRASEAGGRADLTTLYRVLFLAVVATFVIVPLLTTFLGGFKSLGELRSNPFGWPKVFEWQNYGDILSSRPATGS